MFLRIWRVYITGDTHPDQQLPHASATAVAVASLMFSTTLSCGQWGPSPPVRVTGAGRGRTQISVRSVWWNRPPRCCALRPESHLESVRIFFGSATGVLYLSVRSSQNLTKVRGWPHCGHLPTQEANFRHFGLTWWHVATDRSRAALIPRFGPYFSMVRTFIMYSLIIWIYIYILTVYINMTIL